MAILSAVLNNRVHEQGDSGRYWNEDGKGRMKSPVTYVALLRGVNVGGNSMISMSALKAVFERAGFQGVSTYINSGNVLFVSPENDARGLERTIEGILAKRHKLNSKVIVRSFAEIERISKRLEEWDTDTDKAWRHNVIFLSRQIDSKKILRDLRPRENIEKLIYVPGALLWSALIKELTHSNMIKLSRNAIYQEMTVRNPNTVRKLYELMKKTK